MVDLGNGSENVHAARSPSIILVGSNSPEIPECHEAGTTVTLPEPMTSGGFKHGLLNAHYWPWRRR
jgi:hypothetical protein